MADKDMSVGGYRVPKGTPIHLAPYCLHVSSANYQQPFKFWPERWTQHTVPSLPKDKGVFNQHFVRVLSILLTFCKNPNRFLHCVHSHAPWEGAVAQHRLQALF